MLWGMRWFCGSSSQVGSEVGHHAGRRVLFSARRWHILESILTHVCTEEEKLLVGFFGGDYVQYRATTMTLIPFIK